MTGKNNLQDKLEQLGQGAGSDESMVENVMGAIDARTIIPPIVHS